MSLIFRSGKHEGKSIELVKKIDPGYIEWVKENRPEMLEEYKPKVKKQESKEKVQPPEDEEVKPKSLQPNLNFLNEGPNKKE
jgi:hypothetical protein